MHIEGDDVIENIEAEEFEDADEDGDGEEDGAGEDSQAEDAEPDDDDETEDGEEEDPNVNDKAAASAKADDGALTVTLGDDDDEAEKAPEWVRNLRKEHAEARKRIKELEAQVGGGSQPQTATELRKKPTLADHDYEDEAFEKDLEAWFTEKREHDAVVERQKEAEKAETERWQTKLAKFEEGKAALGVKDIDEAEAVVTSTLNQIQMGIVVEAAKNPALVFYALGKNPARAEEVSKISNPIEFARAIFEMEGNLKVTNRKAPPPEKTVRGGKSGGGADNTLEKLREEAGRTGDFSKVIAYKKKRAK